MSRAVSISQLVNTKFNTLDFTGDFEALIGKPELRGSWIIWGDSANGKTRFTLKLAKYLTNFGRVAYNSLEEGTSLSMQRAMIQEGMEQCGRKLILLDQESIEDLKRRLSKRYSPDVVIIDSLQYTGMNYSEYKDLRELFPKKLFIWISHADGKQPYGRIAKQVRYDSFVKIHVTGFIATAQSRYTNSESVPYTIWKKGAERHWNKIN